MSLQERFLDHVYCFFGRGMLTNSYDKNIAECNANECEKIADELAVNFTNWISVKCVLINCIYYLKSDDNIYTMDEILKIYKQEKSL